MGLWWTTLTPVLTTPMSAVHLYWCLGVGRDVTQSAVQFIQCHLSCKLDNGYVKILPPNRIGLLLANQWTSRPTDCSKPWRYYYPPWANIAHICIKNVRTNKTPCSRHAGNPAERNMDRPMHSKMYMIDSDLIESNTLTCKMPRSGKLPPTFNQRQRIMPPGLLICRPGVWRPRRSS
jgi:hypothetical protein